jgi:hypothetical protein
VLDPRFDPSWDSASTPELHATPTPISDKEMSDEETSERRATRRRADGFIDYRRKGAIEGLFAPAVSGGEEEGRRLVWHGIHAGMIASRCRCTARGLAADADVEGCRPSSG